MVNSDYGITKSIKKIVLDHSGFDKIAAAVLISHLTNLSDLTFFPEKRIYDDDGVPEDADCLKEFEPLLSKLPLKLLLLISAKNSSLGIPQLHLKHHPPRLLSSSSNP